MNKYTEESGSINNRGIGIRHIKIYRHVILLGVNRYGIVTVGYANLVPIITAVSHLGDLIPILFANRYTILIPFVRYGVFARVECGKHCLKSEVIVSSVLCDKVVYSRGSFIRRAFVIDEAEPNGKVGCVERSFYLNLELVNKNLGLVFSVLGNINSVLVASCIAIIAQGERITALHELAVLVPLYGYGESRNRSVRVNIDGHSARGFVVCEGVNAIFV